MSSSLRISSASKKILLFDTYPLMPFYTGTAACSQNQQQRNALLYMPTETIAMILIACATSLRTNGVGQVCPACIMGVYAI